MRTYSQPVLSFESVLRNFAVRQKLPNRVSFRAGRLSSFGTILSLAVLSLAGSSAAWAQSGANSDPNYVALRNIGLGNEAVSVSNLQLKRDAGTFRFNSGTICFVPPVNGKVTGAVFVGDGIFLLSPPTETERKSLKYLTKEDEFNEKFERLVLRFTDGTYDEIKRAGTAASGGCDAAPLKDSQNVMRHKIRHNLEAELLAEILSPAPRGVFVAFIHGKRYDDKEIY